MYELLHGITARDIKRPIRLRCNQRMRIIKHGRPVAYAEGLNVLSQANVGSRQDTADAETTPLRNPEHYRYEEEAWRIVDPVLKADTAVHEYEPGTWGPAAVDQTVSPATGWHNPVVVGESGSSPKAA